MEANQKRCRTPRKNPSPRKLVRVNFELQMFQDLSTDVDTTDPIDLRCGTVDKCTSEAAAPVSDVSKATKGGGTLKRKQADNVPDRASKRQRRSAPDKSIESSDDSNIKINPKERDSKTKALKLLTAEGDSRTEITATKSLGSNNLSSKRRGNDLDLDKKTGTDVRPTLELQKSKKSLELNAELKSSRRNSRTKNVAVKSVSFKNSSSEFKTSEEKPLCEREERDSDTVKSALCMVKEKLKMACISRLNSDAVDSKTDSSKPGRIRKRLFDKNDEVTTSKSTSKTRPSNSKRVDSRETSVPASESTGSQLRFEIKDLKTKKSSEVDEEVIDLSVLGGRQRAGVEAESDASTEIADPEDGNTSEWTAAFAAMEQACLSSSAPNETTQPNSTISFKTTMIAAVDIGLNSNPVSGTPDNRSTVAPANEVEDSIQVTPAASEEMQELADELGKLNQLSSHIQTHLHRRQTPRRKRSFGFRQFSSGMASQGSSTIGTPFRSPFCKTPSSSSPRVTPRRPVRVSMSPFMGKLIFSPPSRRKANISPPKMKTPSKSTAKRQLYTDTPERENTSGNCLSTLTDRLKDAKPKSSVASSVSPKPDLNSLSEQSNQLDATQASSSVTDDVSTPKQLTIADDRADTEEPVSDKDSRKQSKTLVEGEGSVKEKLKDKVTNGKAKEKEKTVEEKVGEKEKTSATEEAEKSKPEAEEAQEESDFDVSVPDLSIDIDRKVEETSQRIHLTTRNVQNIIHEVLRDEHVKLLLRNALEGGAYEEKLQAAISERVTRAKLKEYMEKGQIPPPFGITKKPKTILNMNFPEEEDDEEYRPSSEELEHASDDESIHSSVDFGSPKVSFAETRNRLQSGESVSENETTPVATPMGPPPVPPPKPTEPDSKMANESDYAYLTRSKVPLTNTSLDELMASFQAPDIPEDYHMYDNEYTQDDDYRQFLTELCCGDQSGKEGTEVLDDELTDPDFNFLEDSNQVIEDPWENRFDKATKIPKKECKELLMDDIFDDLDDIDQIFEPDDEPCVDNPGLVQSPSAGDSTATAQTLEMPVEMATVLPGACEPDVGMSETRFQHVPPVKMCPGLISIFLSEVSQPQHEESVQESVMPRSCQNVAFTQDELVQLRVQMRKHVQLLTQSYVLSWPQNWVELGDMADFSKQSLTELKTLGENSVVPYKQSYFYASNLEEAVEITQQTYESKSEKVAEVVAKLIKTKYCQKTHELFGLSYEQMEVLATSRVFMYPWMLPEKRFVGHDDDITRVTFLNSEDNLLAIGLEQFGRLPAKFEFIRTYLLPLKTTHQLKNRTKNLTSESRVKQAGNPDNPVKFLTAHNQLPAFPRFLDLEDEDRIVAPKDRDHDLLPKWFSVFKEVQLRHSVDLNLQFYFADGPSTDFMSQLAKIRSKECHIQPHLTPLTVAPFVIFANPTTTLGGQMIFANPSVSYGSNSQVLLANQFNPINQNCQMIFANPSPAPVNNNSQMLFANPPAAFNNNLQVLPANPSIFAPDPSTVVSDTPFGCSYPTVVVNAPSLSDSGNPTNSGSYYQVIGTIYPGSSSSEVGTAPPVGAAPVSGVEMYNPNAPMSNAFAPSTLSSSDMNYNGNSQYVTGYGTQNEGTGPSSAPYLDLGLTGDHGKYPGMHSTAVAPVTVQPPSESLPPVQPTGECFPSSYVACSSSQVSQFNLPAQPGNFYGSYQHQQDNVQYQDKLDTSFDTYSATVKPLAVLPPDAYMPSSFTTSSSSQLHVQPMTAAAPGDSINSFPCHPGFPVANSTFLEPLPPSTLPDVSMTESFALNFGELPSNISMGCFDNLNFTAANDLTAIPKQMNVDNKESRNPGTSSANVPVVNAAHSAQNSQCLEKVTRTTAVVITAGKNLLNAPGHPSPSIVLSPNKVISTLPDVPEPVVVLTEGQLKQLGLAVDFLSLPTVSTPKVRIGSQPSNIRTNDPLVQKTLENPSLPESRSENNIASAVPVSAGEENSVQFVNSADILRYAFESAFGFPMSVGQSPEASNSSCGSKLEKENTAEVKTGERIESVVETRPPEASDVVQDVIATNLESSEASRNFETSEKVSDLPSMIVSEDDNAAAGKVEDPMIEDVVSRGEEPSDKAVDGDSIEKLPVFDGGFEGISILQSDFSLSPRPTVAPDLTENSTLCTPVKYNTLLPEASHDSQSPARSKTLTPTSKVRSSTPSSSPFQRRHPIRSSTTSIRSRSKVTGQHKSPLKFILPSPHQPSTASGTSVSPFLKKSPGPRTLRSIVPKIADSSRSPLKNPLVGLGKRSKRLRERQKQADCSANSQRQILPKHDAVATIIQKSADGIYSTPPSTKRLKKLSLAPNADGDRVENAEAERNSGEFGSGKEQMEVESEREDAQAVGDVDSQTEEENDEDQHLVELLEASTTIRGPQRGRSHAANKAEQKKEIALAMLAPDLLANNQFKEEREAMFAQAYHRKVRKTLEHDVALYVKFLQILVEFGEKLKTIKELYDDMKSLFVDYPELVSDFAGFLSPEQAVECRCFVSNYRQIRSRTFLCKLEIYFQKHPAHFQKCLKAFRDWYEGLCNANELCNTVVPLIRGNTHLVEEFSMFFDDKRPPASRFTKYEEVTIGDSDEENPEHENYEKVDLTNVERNYGTASCPCQCHSSGTERFVKKQRHCMSCGLKVVKGQLYLQTSDKFLRPATVTYCHQNDRKADMSNQPTSHKASLGFKNRKPTTSLKRKKLNPRASSEASNPNEKSPVAMEPDSTSILSPLYAESRTENFASTSDRQDQCSDDLATQLSENNSVEAENRASISSSDGHDCPTFTSKVDRLSKPDAGGRRKTCVSATDDEELMECMSVDNSALPDAGVMNTSRDDELTNSRANDDRNLASDSCVVFGSKAGEFDAEKDSRLDVEIVNLEDSSISFEATDCGVSVKIVDCCETALHSGSDLSQNLTDQQETERLISLSDTVDFVNHSTSASVIQDKESNDSPKSLNRDDSIKSRRDSPIPSSDCCAKDDLPVSPSPNPRVTSDLPISSSSNSRATDSLPVSASTDSCAKDNLPISSLPGSATADNSTTSLTSNSATAVVSSAWSKEEDRLILQTCQALGANRATFEMIVQSLKTRSVEEVSNRVEFLINIFTQLTGGDLSDDSATDEDSDGDDDL